MKSNDMSIVPCKLEIQTCVTEHSGIILAVFIDPQSEIATSRMNCKFTDAFFLLTDESGYIVNVC